MKRLNERFVRRVFPALALAYAVAATAVARDDDKAPAVPSNQPATESEQASGHLAVLRDEFNGKLALDWRIVREDKDHISLTKDPGHLVITTQRGTIHGDVDHDELSQGIRAKNIFLIPDVLSETMDFSITLGVRKFEPNIHYQQVGLICYDDDENYVKWSFEYSFDKPQTTKFVMVRQTDKVPQHDLVTEIKNPSRFWLRITRRGTEYECAYSLDGKDFNVVGSRPWGMAPPKFVGFLAKNGGNPQAGELDVSIESFEFRSPPVAAEAGGKAENP